MVEQATTRDLFTRPYHPYTWGLFQALPRLDAPQRSLTPMQGAPPQMMDPPDQCPFLHRCSKATAECRTSPRPPLDEIADNHWVACYNTIAYN